jgi:hypothetical protein
MIEKLPQTSVLYVKNGEHSKWWPVAKANGQVHAGWSKFETRASSRTFERLPDR